MFKKPCDVKAQQRLSGADRKKLRRCIRDKFSSVSDADIDIILPPKAEIIITKLTNRVHVYSVEGGQPMIFDVDGHGSEIYPTVYALWKVPMLLPSFVLKGGEVSRYILGGADLMFPGIFISSEGLPSFSEGQPWSVKVPGNAFPIAVGVTHMSSQQASKAGFRGKALRIMHYYRDTLWEAAEGRFVPNAGFFEDIVAEDPAFVSAAPTEESSRTEVTEQGDLLQSDDKQSNLQDVKADSENEKIKEAVQQLEVLKVTDEAEEDESGVKEQVSALSVDEMDLLLDKCLLQALHTTLKDKDLPIPGSSLWLNHILVCRPPGITLDVKKSSHKKLSKWLQTKASTGLISAKEDKHRKEVILTGINRNHPDYQGFKPEKRKKDLGESSTPTPTVNTLSQTQIEITELWKSTSHVNPILQAVGANVNHFYTTSEAVDIVFSYVEKENLVKPNDKATVVLNATLCDALYKGTVKRGSTYPTLIHKKDLGSTFLGRMQASHRVTRGNDSAVRKGTVKTIQIMTERRQGNKKVTRVSGLESFLVDADSLASELQKKFACSTTVAELPGKKGQNEVLIQGGVIEDLAKHLIHQYGIPKKYIEILDKTKK